MHFNTLSAILRGGWLIDKAYVHTHLPILANILKGAGNGAELFSGSEGMEKPFVVKNGKKVPAYSVSFNRNLCQYEEILNEKLFEDGSTAVIPVMGPVMKYAGDCGEPGMISRSGWLSDLGNSEKIVKMCFYMDTPGGQADGTPQFADLISSLDIPTLAYVAGGAYSAGAWIASACDEIVLADKYAGIGSVGVYQTFMDFSKYLKKMGVEMKDVYARQSTQKNLSWRMAQQGDLTMIEDSVTDLASHFIDAFGGNRAGKLKNNSWNAGATYDGQAAIDMGMADRIDSFTNAAMPVKKKMISVPAPKTSHNPNSTNMKFPKLFALAGLKTITTEQLDVANGELTVNEITSVTLVQESVIEEAANLQVSFNKIKTQLDEANASLQTVKTELGTSKTELETAKKDLTTSQTKVTELEGKVEAFGKNAGDKHNASAGADTPAAETDQEWEAKLDAMPHNKTADRLVGTK